MPVIGCSINLSGIFEDKKRAVCKNTRTGTKPHYSK